eukprot:scaffold36074_cov144-Skeletonema_dohrnii-CCMP3373.AAC.2
MAENVQKQEGKLGRSWRREGRRRLGCRKRGEKTGLLNKWARVVARFFQELHVALLNQRHSDIIIPFY